MNKIKCLILGFIFAISITAPITNTLAAGSYDYQLTSQSSYPSNLSAGATTSVWIEVKNTGTATWNKNVRLGSGSSYGSANQHRDYDSEFANSDWLSANRPTAISDDNVAPGQTTKFQFTIKAPSTNGVYKAYFTPVVDGYSWMKDIGIYWQITVGDGSAQNTSAISNSTQTTLGPSTIQSKFAPSVTKVICGDSSTLSGFGSGTLFYDSTKSKYVVTTNLHVVKQDSGEAPKCLIQVYKSLSDTSAYVLYKSSGYSFYNNNVDFAIIEPNILTQSDYYYSSYYSKLVRAYNFMTGYSLEINSLRVGSKDILKNNSLNYSVISGNTANVGDGVYIIGYPYSEGANATMTSGVITGTTTYNNSSYLVTNAKVNSGVSGGLVVNEYGKLIGIPTILITTSEGNTGYILYFNDLFNKFSAVLQ